MAQLSDDCFAFGGPMLSVDEAVGIIAAKVTAVQEIESVPLVAADGRILARDIAAPLPLPPFTNSAVDGYAVHGSDLPRDTEKAFPVKGRVAAGGVAEAGRSPARPCASSRARRCRRGPTPSSCRRMCASIQKARWCFLPG